MENNLSLWHLNKEQDRIESVVNTKLENSKTAVDALNINAKTVNNCTVQANVPPSALFITQEERTKLAGIQSGAQVNTSNFNKFRVGDQLVVADNANSTLTLVAEEGIVLTPNPNSDTIAIKGVNLYVHPATHSIQMITGASVVAKTGSYNDLLNKPTSMPANGGNADKLDDKSSEDFLQKMTTIDISIVNNANYKIAYVGDIAPTVATKIGLDNEWYHIIYIPHTNGNGFGCQMVMKFNSGQMSIRTAVNLVWGGWSRYSIEGHIHDYNSLTNKPTSMPANGGNSNTVGGKTVNDSGTTTDFLWTAAKIIAELNKKANSSHTHSYLPLSGGSLTGKLLLQNGTGTTGGFSFAWDGALDTGIFSPSDGLMNFYNNGSHTYYVDSTGITIINGKTLKHDTSTIIGGDGKVYNAVFNDLAEWFKKGDNNLEAGDIISYDELSFARKCNLDNAHTTVGVYSDTYGFCLGGDNIENMDENHKHYVPIGISGRVKVKVTGDIKPGDFITCSNIPGVGTKGDFMPGKMVGKTLEFHKGQGIDRIWILIMNI